MTDTKPSLFELLDTTTGHDEAAVAQAFGADLWDTYGAAFPSPTEWDPTPRGSQQAAMTIHRMAVFVHRLHEGDQPGKAKKAALDLTAKDALGYFAADEDPGVDPDDDPATDVGKDAADSE